MGPQFDPKLSPFTITAYRCNVVRNLILTISNPSVKYFFQASLGGARVSWTVWNESISKQEINTIIAHTRWYLELCRTILEIGKPIVRVVIPLGADKRDFLCDLRWHCAVQDRLTAALHQLAAGGDTALAARLAEAMLPSPPSALRSTPSPAAHPSRAGSPLSDPSPKGTSAPVSSPVAFTPAAHLPSGATPDTACTQHGRDGSGREVSIQASPQEASPRDTDPTEAPRSLPSEVLPQEASREEATPTDATRRSVSHNSHTHNPNSRKSSGRSSSGRSSRRAERAAAADRFRASVEKAFSGGGNTADMFGVTIETDPAGSSPTQGNPQIYSGDCAVLHKASFTHQHESAPSVVVSPAESVALAESASPLAITAVGCTTPISPVVRLPLYPSGSE